MTTAMTGAMGGWLAPAHAESKSVLPTKGRVVAGSATIGKPSGTSLSITQQSNRAVIDWNSFSIGQPNSVNFWQPSRSAAILNRVTGATPSSIAGALNANGQVYLVNPNGIAITRTGNVRVGGGFVASTLAIDNGDFMAKRLRFHGDGASGAVSNAGSITAGADGFVALIGGTAANSGTISVPLGKVALGSGERATLDLNGDGFMQVAVPTGAKTASGQALVSNSGKVTAAGGVVELEAATVANAMRDAVNMSGVVAANSVSGHNGAVVLGGGPGGAVAVTGKIDVSAPLTGTVAGGSVTVNGARVTVGRIATIDASGAMGGTVLIGVSGRDGVDKAKRTIIEAGAQLLARGNPADAHSGGYIETSGEVLTVGGAAIDAGHGGQWLVDPDDLTIDTAAATTIDNALGAGTSVTEQTTATLANGSGTTSSGSGDITVAAPLSWGTTATLTLDSFHSINIDAGITVGGAGTLVLTTNNNNGGASSGGTLNIPLGQGSVQFSGGSAVGAGLTIDNTAYTLLYDMAGGPTSIQSMNTSTGHFALAMPIDASTWGSFVGAPVGSFAGTFNGLGNTISNLTVNSFGGEGGLFGSSSGTVANIGLIGNLISGNSTTDAGGLAGQNTGTITNAYASGSVIVNAGEAGGLVGNNNGGTISQAHTTGTVTDTGISVAVGGLVGSNFGTIVGAYSTATVIGAYAGGLVGLNHSNGTIDQSYATGTVSGGAYSGGLVAWNDGTISNAYATGAASGTNVGGLVGINNSGDIEESYATGVPTGGAAGGLVGLNFGAISDGYWDTTTSGTMTGIGSGSGTATALLSGALPSGFSTSIWANAGNQTTPYLVSNNGPVYVGSDTFQSNVITTPTQLQAINNAVTANYVLVNNLDLSGMNFTPIDESAGFNGIFNGLNHTISNLTITGTSTYTGLFGQIGSAGSVENIGILGGSINANSAAAAGPLAGQNLGTISNAYATMSILDGGGLVGGLVGVNGGGTITNSYATGQIVGFSSTGGLVGFMAGGTIANSYATGAVDSGFAAGGLVGEINTGTLQTVYAAGAVAGSGDLGGLIGRVDSSVASVSAAFWDQDRAGVGISGFGDILVGGAVITGTVQGLSSSAPFTLNDYVGFNASATPGQSGNAWVMVDANGTLNNNVGAVGGMLPMLASEYATTIQNAHQLQLMAMNTSASYTLGGNVDAAATGTSADVWDAAGFIPVGGNGVGPFNGNFNGAGGTISNLTIKSAQPTVGLFGALSGGMVANFALNNLSVTGTSKTSTVDDGAGGLAGNQIGGIILNVATSGAVTGSKWYDTGGLVGFQSVGTISFGASSATVTMPDSSSVGRYAGGLVGELEGTVTESFATGTVTNVFQDAGGLVGKLSNGTITKSYATGTTIGLSAGGLVAATQGGSISQSYATGAVNGSQLAGGLVEDDQNTLIDQTYATGAVIGGTLGAGGLIASSFGGAVTNSYWDTQTTGRSASAGTATPQTTAQLQAALPSGFDNTAWGILPGQSYPYLLWRYPTTPQVLTGIAYSDMGVTPVVAGPVTAIVQGSALGAISTGANGYYYFVEPTGTISSGGSAVLAYTGTSTAGGARLQILTGTTTGFDIWGDTLIAPTAAVSLSTAPTTGNLLATANTGLLGNAIGSVPGVPDMTSFTNAGYIATAPGGFTVDVSPASPGFYAVTTAIGAGITVSAPIAVSQGLTL
ncbi:MAG TPA: GLUG motif-containing protein, partial [Stellaceae bacterium]